jgi:hypothetical protein
VMAQRPTSNLGRVRKMVVVDVAVATDCPFLSADRGRCGYHGRPCEGPLWGGCPLKEFSGVMVRPRTGGSDGHR